MGQFGSLKLVLAYSMHCRNDNLFPENRAYLKGLHMSRNIVFHGNGSYFERVDRLDMKVIYGEPDTRHRLTDEEFEQIQNILLEFNDSPEAQDLSDEEIQATNKALSCAKAKDGEGLHQSLEDMANVVTIATALHSFLNTYGPLVAGAAALLTAF